MSLFVINRYDNDECKQETGDSYNHLSDLLNKISERKRERDALKVANEGKIEEIPEETNEPCDKTIENKVIKKKSKKRKFDALECNVITKNDTIGKETQLESQQCLTENVQKSFLILNRKKKLKSQSVKRVLPDWLMHPEIVSSDLKNGSAFDEVESLLSVKILDKLKQEGLKKLFPVQVILLSWILKCDIDYKSGKWVRDTCVCMPTGSGKTLAYALPIIQVLQQNFVRMVRCLIVLPVQELASQVYEVIMKYASCTSLKVALISGATSFTEEQDILVQKNEKGHINSLVDIIIATPGRLIDHIRKTTGFSLSNLRFLVIDEADRATEWLQYIPFPHSKAPPLTLESIRSGWNKPAQKILLSATLSQDPEKLKSLGLFRPILFTSVVNFEIDEDINLDEHCNNVSYYGNPSELTERIVQCAPQHKPLALYQLLTKDETVEKSLVFTNSSKAAHRLTILLQSLLKSKDVQIAELSAQLGSKQREETLDKFIQGTIRILVSSDALARGLDIPKVKLVISYDLPKHIKGYIHRAGRTGRGGIPGTAVSILLPNQTNLFRKMLKGVGKLVPDIEEENLDEIADFVNYASHLDNLKTLLSNEQDENVRRSKSRKGIAKT